MVVSLAGWALAGAAQCPPVFRSLVVGFGSAQVGATVMVGTGQQKDERRG